MKIRLASSNTRSARSAFTLIEVSLALGVASFCLLSVFGLVPVGLAANQNSAQQTAAAGIATAISADLRGTPVAAGTTSRFQIPVPAAAGSGMHTIFFSQDGTPAPGRTVDSPPVPRARILPYTRPPSPSITTRTLPKRSSRYGSW